jgi:hypothetical protein
MTASSPFMAGRGPAQRGNNKMSRSVSREGLSRPAVARGELVGVAKALTAARTATPEWGPVENLRDAEHISQSFKPF